MADKIPGIVWFGFDATAGLSMIPDPVNVTGRLVFEVTVPMGSPVSLLIDLLVTIRDRSIPKISVDLLPAVMFKVTFGV